MNVLVINCGSSSLKYQLINSDTEDVLAKGLCERIGIDGRLVYQKAGSDKEITECAMPTHKEAIQFVLDALTNDKTGAIKSLKEVDAIGHRIVHGGEKFASSAVPVQQTRRSRYLESSRSRNRAYVHSILQLLLRLPVPVRSRLPLSRCHPQYRQGLPRR